MSAAANQPASGSLPLAIARITAGIADLVHGRTDAATRHDIGVGVRSVVELAGSSPDLVLAGEDLIAACEALEEAVAGCPASVTPRPSSPEAREADQALHRLRRRALTRG